MLFEEISKEIRYAVGESSLKKKAQDEVDPRKGGDNPVKRAVDKVKKAKKDPTRDNIANARAQGWRAIRYAKTQGKDGVADQIRSAMDKFPSPHKARKVRKSKDSS